MPINIINSLLSNLVAFTHERDETALKIALIKTLSEYIALIQTSHSLNAYIHANKTKSVVIYHLKDVKKQLLTALSADTIRSEIITSAQLKQSILNCFSSGQICTHEHAGEPNTKLFPIKNLTGQTVSIIGVEVELASMSQETNLNLDITIPKLLQVYQNFTGLIKDNECDALTGLLNRKTFDYRVNKIFTQIQKATNGNNDQSNRVFFLAIFDIDHFKRVNDQFGHLIGDEVLLLISQLMRQSFREADPLFRFGGEEFVGIFECNNINDIHHVLERFRSKVEQFEFPQIGKVTISSGYTTISAFDTSSQLIDHADTALYYAKNHGRNRIDFYEQLIAEGQLEEIKKEGEIELF
ncbi:MAG: GGDEF domain-containing protein [Methylotenera sp.]